MGFDTYLEVDGEILLQWRKHTAFQPRLLFRHDQIVVEARTDDAGSDDYRPSFRVAYEATAADVLTNLEQSGLGWHAAVAAYGETRIEGTAGGIVLGQAFAEGGSTEEAESRLASFLANPPVRDLEHLGRFLAHRWRDPDVVEVELFRELTYDGLIDSISQVSMEVFRHSMDMEGIDAALAVRGTESWAVLYREAPLLAWPILICTLLKHLPPTTLIVYDISEAADQENPASVEEARAFADEYWRWSSEALSGVAKSMGRLFSVLASFDSKLGRDFWFARAADLLGRLDALADATDDVTSKARGDALEALADAIIRTEEPELQVVEKNFKTKEEEIDLIVANSLKDPFWVAQHSPLVVIECKNWRTEKPGVAECRIFESKMQDRGALCRVGIFVSMYGFSKTFLERLKSIQREGGVIFAVTGDDLKALVASKTRLTEWLAGPGVVRSLGK